MVYCFGDYELDEERRELRRAGQHVATEPKVFAVLLYLLQHRDRVITKAELLAQCWAETSVSEWALTQCLTKIRRAIQPAQTDPRVLKTVHRQGYRFVGEVSTSPKQPPPQSPVWLTASPSQPSQPVAPDVPLVRHHTPRLDMRPLVGAERRQLTVLHAALDDTFLRTSQRDPEALLEILRAFQTACVTVIERFGGHLAQALPEGLMVYFGYPQAHDDDAHRAVRAGLHIVDALCTNPPPALQINGGRPAVRIGIHTGLVVVGELGAGAGQPAFAVGETPGVAAHLQALAHADSVVISAATAQLVAGYFTWQMLGEHFLPGGTIPLALYRVLRKAPVQTRLEVEAPRGLTPFVGRQAELTVLRERWAQVQEGMGQLVVLSGEAGIGKSRLMQVLKTHLVGEPHMLMECRSSPYYQHTAFYPMVDLLERICQFQRDDALEAKLTKLEQTLSQYRLPTGESVRVCGALLSLPLPEERYPPLPWTPQQQRQKTLETLLAILVGLGMHRPVVLILEDVHWTDASTLELLGLLVDHIPTARLLVMLVCRPAFQPAWGSRSYLTRVTLARLSQQQTEQMVTQVTCGKPLPVEVVQQIVAKADGVPLFIEELTKTLLESGHLKETPARYELIKPLHAVEIPATLQDSLMARLDRLGATKEVAQLGATIGRRFSYELLQAVASVDEVTLQGELGQLVAAELIYQQGLPPQAHYRFKHALVRDTAYASLLKRTRQQVHERIAQVLEARFPEMVESQPEVMAHHYTEANLTACAVEHWYKAGQQASARLAYVEATRHLRKGLELLKTLPETPERAQQELDVLMAFAPVLHNTEGQAAPEVGAIYSRAYALCQQVAETPQIFPILRGLWNYYLVRAELQTARKLGQQFFRLAQRHSDPISHLWGHNILGLISFYTGAGVQAQEHFEQGIDLYEVLEHRSLASVYGQDSRVVCLSFAAFCQWIRGYPDQALQRIHQALTLAQEVAHPFSLARVLVWVARVHQFRREPHATQKWAEAALAFCREQGFPFWLAAGTMLQGWAQVEQQPGVEAIEQIHQGMDAWRATGAKLWVPYHLALLTEAYLQTGQVEAGLNVCAEALILVDQTGECWWEAELHRLKGELLLQPTIPDQPQAETCLQQALNLARQQQAKALELRAATSLSRLWQRQGRQDEARQLLAPIYGWFTEGFDTADLLEAKALLETL
jgi:predicted ATPase/class 3 adenylate cyclase/DNA-binding winged helix-turn-helix (wHTH) protein